MARSTYIKNYNDLSGCVVTDLNKLQGAPENAVKYSVNYEFDRVDGASRRKALDLETGISGNDYVQLNSSLGIGATKNQVFTFKGVLNQLADPTHDIVLNTFEGKGIVYELGSDQQLADAVKDSSVVGGSIADSEAWLSVAWSPELEIMIAVDPDKIMISDDGINWGDTGYSGTAIPASVMWCPELKIFVVSCSSANDVLTSKDGITWTERYQPSSSGLKEIVWSPELALFVAITGIAGGAGGVYTSPDGITWTSRTVPANSSLVSVVWASEISLFVAVGTGTATRCATSPDGITWTSRTLSNNGWASVAWSADLTLLVAVGAGTTNYVATSPDGVTWTNRTAPESNQWKSVIWSKDLAKFVAVSQNGTHRVMTSTDGISWSAPFTVELSQWQSVIWIEELSRLVAVANSGTVRTMYSATSLVWYASGSAAILAGNAHDWTTIQGISIGATGLPNLSVLYNTGATVYNLTTTLGLGDGPLIRDFAGVPEDIADDEKPDVTLFTVAAIAGTHDGAGNSAFLSDSTAAWTTDALVGLTINNTTDGSSGTITANTANTVTATLSGGTEDDWDVSDAYTISSTFTEGEDITVANGTVTRRYRIVDKRTATTFGVDKSLIDSTTTEFDGADNTDLSGSTVVGASSGAAATLSSNVNDGLSDAHRYNLVNQGWTQAYMDTYAKSQDVWPSNVQTWYSGRDSSNNFSPTELDKVSFGNSRAPRGHIILNQFKEWRHAKVPGVWIDSVPPVNYTRGFTTIAEFGSRMALSGASINGSQNVVYISPVLDTNVAAKNAPSITDLDFSKMMRFHQANDPTADIQNDLLPDDGVAIPVAGATRVYKIAEFHNSLLVIAENGVWAISGLDLQTGFKTDSFSVYKIAGASGSKNPRSVVTTESRIFYWADDGIYAIGRTEQGDFTAANVSVDRIEGLYNPIDSPNKAAAIGYHDATNFKVYWAYNTTAGAAYPELRNGLLVLDLRLNGFYPLTVQTDFADAGGDLSAYLFSINGFTQDTAYPSSDGTVPLKLIIGEHFSNGTADIKHSVMEFNNGGQAFYDFVTYRNDVHSLTDLVTPQDTYIDSWDDSLGDTTRRKQGIWVFTHMKKTETGFTDLGGGALAPVGESGMTMQSRWDWHDSSAGGRWGTAREIYRHKRPYVPVDDTDTYDTGESIITTKNKIYGRGRALSLRFTAQDGKDSVLHGYAIPYSIENAP